MEFLGPQTPLKDSWFLPVAPVWIPGQLHFLTPNLPTSQNNLAANPPGQTQKSSAFATHSQCSQGPVTLYPVTSQGGGHEPSPDSDGQSASIP